jgi:hypothetical protein
MTLPASATKVYLDSATDDPKQARPELADLVDKFNDLLTHLNLSTITSSPAAIPLSVSNGGTGASTEAGARTNLGVADATEMAPGRIEIANQTEANNGTDDTRALTPAKLANISPASVSLASGDQFLILDASDSNKLKRASVSVGKLLQQVYSSSSSVVSTTTQIPDDDTIPQNTEGGEFLTATITPSSSSNLLLIEAVVAFTLSGLGGTTQVIGALFQDSTANAIAASRGVLGGSAGSQFVLRHRMTAGTTSATTFKLRAGAIISGTLYMNANASGTRVFGGVSMSSLTVSEISA